MAQMATFGTKMATARPFCDGFASKKLFLMRKKIKKDLKSISEQYLHYWLEDSGFNQQDFIQKSSSG
jgi:hypothetical protein